MRITFPSLDAGIQHLSAILAFEAIRMIIFSESSQTGSFNLSFTRDNGSFTSCAAIRLFLGIIVRAVNALLFIQDKLIMRQVFVANHASEAFWMESSIVSPHHMPNNLLIASWAFVAFCTIMLFAVVLFIQGVTGADDWFAAIVTFFRPQFVISFAYGFALICEILASQGIATYKATHTSGMVKFLSGFDTIPLDWLLAYATLLHDFLPILCAIRFPVLLKKLSVNASFADAALKALFMIDLAKGRAAFHRHGFHAHAAFSDLFFHGLGHPVSDLGLNFRIIEVRMIGAF